MDSFLDSTDIGSTIEIDDFFSDQLEFEQLLHDQIDIALEESLFECESLEKILTEENVPTVYECYNCEEKFFQKSDLKKHIKKEHKRVTQSKVNSSIRKRSRAKEYLCGVCDYRCKHKGHFNRHLRTHTQEARFACNFCNYKCPEKKSLITHLSSHTGKKPFACHVCDYECSEKRNMLVHIRIHTGEKPFACEVCGARFSATNNLKVHMRFHTGEKPFTCKICNCNFKAKCNLIVHMRIHTGERPFACEICEIRFSEKNRLNRHIRTPSHREACKKIIGAKIMKNLRLYNKKRAKKSLC